MILHSLSLVDWSETRWCKVKVAGRRYLRCRLLGIEGLVRTVQADANANTELLGGAARATSTVRKYFCVASVSAQAPEKVLCSLLEDDRFLRHGASMRTSMVDQLEQLCAYPRLLWERMAMVINDGVSWLQIRHECLYASTIGCGYLEMEMFEDLDILPFKLTQGDIAANVNALIAQPRHTVHDETALKIKTAAGLGHHVQGLIDGVCLMRDLAATINVVEQGHAAAAIINRDRKFYSSKTLADRSLLFGSRRPFPARPV